MSAPKAKSIRLLSGFFTVGFWTLMSRIAGFAREILIAAFFGAGPVAQAFQVAFSLPNMFRRFFAEGAFNMAFVPMFSKRVEGEDDPAGFANDAFAALSSVLIVFTLIAMLFMPWLVWAMASGFVGDARFDLATDFGRICFPYILFISLAALFSGVLNALGRFAMAAAAPVFLNFILVGAMLWGYWQGLDMGLALAWGVPVAGIVQLGLVWFAAERAGIRIRPKLPKFTPEMRNLAIVAAPAALAGGVVQINLLVGRQVASYFDGAIQWLAVADRLYQLPLGVVGIAIGVVLLPDLSRKLRNDDVAGSKEAFNRAAEFSMALTIPAAVGLMVIPFALTSVLFERGAFTTQDSHATALVLAVYGAGLPAFVLQKVFQPLYFAREDTQSPFRYAIVAMIINAVIAIGASIFIGYVAAAAATTISSWAMVWLLWRGTKNMGDAAHFDARLRKTMPKYILASILMGAILWITNWLLGDMILVDFWRYIALLILICVGIVSFGIFSRSLGVFSNDDLRRLRNTK